MTLSPRSVGIVILTALYCGLCGCNPEHGIRVISSVANPQDGGNDLQRITAQVIEEDYGATVANITTVRLLTSDGKPFGQGDGGVFSYYRGQPKITVSWKDSEHLLIACPDCVDERNVTLKEVKHNRIYILYNNEARQS